MDKTKIKNIITSYGAVACLGLVGFGVVMLLPRGVADNSVEGMRSEQAEIDKKIIELKPLYEAQRSIFEKAQEEMTRIETEAKQYREKSQSIQSSIEAIRDGKKE